jgi:hypothetical protein
VAVLHLIEHLAQKPCPNSALVSVMIVVVMAKRQRDLPSRRRRESAPCLPLIRIAGGVQNGQHGNPAVDYQIENAVRKPAQQSAANAAMDIRIQKWILRDAFEGFFDAVQEVIAQTTTALLIEGVAARKIALGFRADEYLASHVRRS